MPRLVFGLAAVMLLAGGVGQADAGIITSLFGTGVDSNGNYLPDGSVDPHYTLSGFGSQTSAYVVGNPNALGWADNLTYGAPPAEWISIDHEGGTLSGLPVGTFDYTTTFSLTGFNPSSAVLTGYLSGDDSGEIFINGVDTGAGTGYGGWTTIYPFTINSSNATFVPGINTLTIVDSNSSGPIGEQLDIVGSANPATAVPEPTTLTLCGIGVVGLFGYGSSRQRQAS